MLQRGERMVHRHRPPHDLLLVITDGSNDRRRPKEYRLDEGVLALSLDLKLVPEQVLVRQREGPPCHRVDTQHQLRKPADHWKADKPTAWTAARHPPVPLDSPL